MKLSVIVVNYNVQYFLEQALQSVERSVRFLHGTHPDWAVDVWVVDNNSPDGSVEMVRSRFSWVKLIANKDNTGFSYANNQAIRQSAGEYVLLLNPDTVVPEDCFLRTLEFMDTHPEAGGLGIKMLDGSGNFLPESKRGFPSPEVAFYKIFGLSKFFPRSRRFGQYHLSYLSKGEVHTVDVLAGAFMLLRRDALEKIGLLDEDFFMYGEDIDLSYRIIKGGYKNYYYPGSEIIHYKGESTKKSSINYVFVFYRAMVIFAKKHLPKEKAALFAVFINLAIYLRAGVAVVFRVIRQLALPVLDFAVLYGLMFLLVRYWERTIKYIHGGQYPDILLNTFVPIYILFWIVGVFLGRGYQWPYGLKRIIRGVFIGTAALAVFYAFLPENYRFSRALIVFGAAVAIVGIVADRLLVELITSRKIRLDRSTAKRIIIVGTNEEAQRVLGLLDKSRLEYSYLGRVGVNGNDSSSSGGEAIGQSAQMEELVKIYRPDELIFCSRDINYQDTIHWMEKLNGKGIDFKMVPENSVFVIGSNSKNEPGDYYALSEDPAIVKSDNKLNKRILDVALSVGLLITLPLNVWLIRRPFHYITNLWEVLNGKKSWVGYSNTKNLQCPPIRNGVLSPADELPYRQTLDEATLNRLDYLYAKDYSVYKDLSIILNGFSRLGK